MTTKEALDKLTNLMFQHELRMCEYRDKNNKWKNEDAAIRHESMAEAYNIACGVICKIKA